MVINSPLSSVAPVDIINHEPPKFHTKSLSKLGTRQDAPTPFSIMVTNSEQKRFMNHKQITLSPLRLEVQPETSRAKHTNTCSRCRAPSPKPDLLVIGKTSFCSDCLGISPDLLHKPLDPRFKELFSEILVNVEGAQLPRAQGISSFFRDIIASSNTMSDAALQLNEILHKITETDAIKRITESVESFGVTARLVMQTGSMVAFVAAAVSLKSEFSLTNLVTLFAAALFLWEELGDFVVATVNKYILSYFGPKSEGLCGIEELVKTIFPVWFTISTGGEKSTPEQLNAFLKVCGSTAKNADAFGDVCRIVLDMLEKATNFILEKCFDCPPFFAFSNISDNRLECWVKDVQSFSLAHRNNEVKIDRDSHTRVCNLYQRGLYFTTDKVLLRDRSASHIIDRMNQVLKELLVVYANHGHTDQALRMRPLGLFFCGAPGVGKTFGAVPFLQELIVATRTTREEAICCAARPNDQVYSHVSEQKFATNYRGQVATLLDEAGQIRMGVGLAENSDSMKAFRWISDLPYVTDQAHIELKGKCNFTSEIVMFTSNQVGKWDDESIFSTDAFKRRFDYIVEVKIAQGFRNDDIHSDHFLPGALNTDHPLLQDEEFHKEVYEYHVKTSWNSKKVDILDFEELMILCQKRHAVLRDKSSKINAAIHRNNLERVNKVFGGNLLVPRKESGDGSLQMETLERRDSQISNEGLCEDMRERDERVRESLMARFNAEDSDCEVSDSDVEEDYSDYDSSWSLEEKQEMLLSLDWTFTNCFALAKIDLGTSEYIDSYRNWFWKWHGRRLFQEDILRFMFELSGSWHGVAQLITIDKPPVDSFFATAREVTGFGPVHFEKYIRCKLARIHHYDVHGDEIDSIVNTFRDYQTALLKKIDELRQRYPRFFEILKILGFLSGSFALGLVVWKLISMTMTEPVKEEEIVESSLRSDKELVPEKELTPEQIRKKYAQKVPEKAVKEAGDLIKSERHEVKILPGMGFEYPGTTYTQEDVQCKVRAKALYASHMYQIFFEGQGRIGLGLFIDEQLVLMNKHFIKIIKNQSDLSSLQIRFQSVGNPWYSFLIPGKRLLETYAQNSDADLVMHNLSEFKSIRSHKRIFNAFITAENLLKIDEAFAVRLLLYRDEKESARLIPARFLKCMGFYDTIDDARNQVRMDKDMILNTALSYVTCTKGADCGSPVLLNCAQIRPGKILGFHAGGDKSQTGFASVITREEIFQMRERLNVLVPFTGNMACAVKEGAESWISELGFEIVEKVPIGYRVNSPARSKIVKSPLHNWVPCEKRPARLGPGFRDNVFISPMQIGLKKYGPKSGNYDQDTLEQACDLYLSDLTKAGIAKVEWKTYTLEQGLFGDTDISYFDPLQRSTSMGWPWSVDAKAHKGFSGKEALMGKPGDAPGQAPMYDDIMSAAKRLVIEAATGADICAVYTDTLKDECLSLKKWEEWRSRVFGAGPVHLTIVKRAFFADLSRFLVLNRVNNGCFIGVNPMSSEWELGYKYMHSKGNRVTSVDASAFDSSHLKSVMITVYDRVVAPLYGDSDPNANRVRKGLWVDMCNSKHIVYDTVYRWEGGLPSGDYLTAIFNTMMTAIYWRYSWLRACQESNNIDKSIEYRKYVYDGELGDDVMANIHASVTDWFNALTVQKFAKELNYTITPENKLEQLEPYKLDNDYSFLKRENWFHPVLEKHVGKLSLSTVLQSCQWTKRGMLSRQIVQDKVELLLMELSLYPEEVYKQYVGRLQKICIQKMDWSPPVVSYKANAIRTSSEMKRWYDTKFTESVCDLASLDNFLEQEGEVLLHAVNSPGAPTNGVTEPCTLEQPSSNIANSSAAGIAELQSGVRNQLAATNSNITGAAVTPQTDGNLVAFHTDDMAKEVSFSNEMDIPQELKNIAKDGSNHDLKAFLRRPIPIATAEWNISQTDGTGGGPATSLIEISVPSTIIRYQMYMVKLMGILAFRPRTTKLRLVVNTNRFQAGRLSMVAFPNPQNDVKYRTVMRKTALWTALPRVDFDAATDSEVILELPYVSDQTFYNLDTAEKDYWKVNVMVYSQLQAITGQTTAEVTLFASFEDVEVEYPTIPSLAQPQSGRRIKKGDPTAGETAEEDHPMSATLRTISTIADAGSHIPLLSSVAGPLSWATGMMSQAAASFGFSNPLIQPSISNMNLKMYPYGPNCSGEDNSYNLGLFQDNAVEHLPGWCGTDEDDMSLVSLCKIPAYVGVTSWSTGGVSGTLLKSFDVGPLSSSFITASNYVNPAAQTRECATMPPLSYCALNFAHWRGCINITVKLVKTEFHSGRLAVVFVPSMRGTAAGMSYSAATYAHKDIIDIRQSSEFTFAVPFVATTPYKSVRQTTACTVIDAFPSTVDYVWNGRNNTENTCVGRVLIFVVNPLIAPTTVASSIQLLYEVNAADNFELASLMPNAHIPMVQTTAFSGGSAQVLLANPVFQSGLAVKEAGDAEGTVQQDAQRSNEEGQNLGGAECLELSDMPSRVCIGERISSIRQIVKRAVTKFRYGTWDDEVNASGGHSANIVVHPWVTQICIDGNPDLHAATAPNIQICNDYIDIFGALFAYHRGSVRLKVATLGYGSGNVSATIQPAINTVLASGAYNVVHFPIQAYYGNNLTTGLTINWMQCYESAQIGTRTAALEVQAPYYSRVQQTPIYATRNGETYGSQYARDDQPVPAVTIAFRENLGRGPVVNLPKGNFSLMNCYRQAGEDYSMGLFSGVPLVTPILAANGGTDFTTNMADDLW